VNRYRTPVGPDVSAKGKPTTYPTLPDPFWSWLTRYRRGQNPAQAIPQGDRKGPHPAPHRPRPYNDTSLCDTPLVVIVRAGAVWSGVGTLAVALLVGLLSPLSLPFACDVE